MSIPFNLQQLKHFWLKRLYQEIESIYWHRSMTISKPSLDICELASVWGDYDASTQHLRLSQNLLSTQPWSTIVGVLHHELAHHAAWFLGFSGTDHGLGFQQACDVLGVPPIFRRATGDLPEQTKSEEEPAYIDLLRRIEKLLALAGSTNEHEAALAMNRAHDLMLRYNIDHPSPHREFKESIIRLGKSKTSTLATSVASLLVAHYHVQVVHSTEYDPLTNRELRTLHVLGEAHFVDMAEYAFHYLVRTTESLWLQYKASRGARTVVKTSFQLGVVNGFSKKMTDAERQREASWDSTSYALAIAEPPGFQSFLRDRFPRLRKTANSGRRIHSDVYDHGHSQGRNITVNRGVSEQRGGSRHLLLS